MNESSNANDQGAQQGPPPKDGEQSAQNAEPVISSTDYEFSAPELGAVEISEDVAESVDLEAAEAEAARVEHEAQLAARLVSSPAAGHTPAEVTPAEVTPAEVTPAGVEPESPVEDAVPEAPPAPGPAPHLRPGVDHGHGWRRPETPWQQSATPWQPKAGQWQSPAQVARGEEEATAALLAAGGEPATPDAGQAAPDGQPTSQGAPAPFGQDGTPEMPPVPGFPGGPQGPGQPDGPHNPGLPGGPGFPGGQDDNGNSRNKLFIVLGVVVVGLALIAFFIWLLVSFVSGSTQSATTTPLPASQSQVQKSGTANATDAGSPGNSSDGGLIIAALSPLKWIQGDCLRDVKDQATPADVVRCSTPHGAQLVGTFYFGDSEAYPGVDALKAKATAVCRDAQFTTDAAAIKTLKQSTAYPSEASWKDKDDRRVDCLVYDTRGGNPLVTSLVK
ncbi:septum formation family protein [Arthrobacter sp. LAPM80]|uniref:septum formation family protein n=1 Tax=Arthrobacter sp. LAPM80 TaxID=3141788 RepID=UPI00398B0EF5